MGHLVKKRWILAVSAGVASAGFALVIPAAHALDACIPRCGIIEAAEGSSIEPNPNDLRASVYASVSIDDGSVVVSRRASVSSASIVNGLGGVPSITHDGPGPVGTAVGVVDQATARAEATVGATESSVANTAR